MGASEFTCLGQAAKYLLKVLLVFPTPGPHPLPARPSLVPGMTAQGQILLAAFLPRQEAGFRWLLLCQSHWAPLSKLLPP